MTTTIDPPAAQPDNLFGVCAALGEDFGFNPLWLRIALGAGILWNPLAVFGLYGALGLAVLATRLLFPDHKPVEASEQPARPTLSEPANEPVVLARAA